MALSGSFKNQFFREYGLEMDWTATQDIANNTSTITCKLYLCSYSSSYTISSSATKSGYIQIDGTNLNFTTAGASLAGNQRKLLTTQSRTISHNADGTKTAYLLGSYSINVTLSGVYHGTITVGGNAVLNTIPRASTVSSNVTWTAGIDNLYIAVSRASSSFTHQALLYIQNPSGTWEYIAETDINNKFGTSTTLVFNSTHITRMYTAIGGYENRPTKLELRTYSGSTLIGTSTRQTANDKVYGVTPATITFNNFNIGDSIPTTVRDMYSGFTYRADFTFGAFTKTFTLDSSNPNPTFTFTPEEIQAMYNETPNSNSKDGNVFVSSKYNGIEINDGIPVNQNKSFTAFVTNSNPTMGDVFSYSDTNAQTVALTNDSRMIIQGYSTVRVVIPVGSKATATNGATMKEYIATLNGVEAVEPFSDVADVVIDFGTINAVIDQTLTITAVDSRGNIVEKTKEVIMIPYNLPTINASAKRESNFENETTLKMSGSYSLLTINGINKNTLQSVQYRYKPTTVETYTTWDTWQNFDWSISPTATNEYSAIDVLLALDNTQAWHVEFMVADLLESVVFSATVGTGQPILFIDNAKKSIGVGKFPTLQHAQSIDVEGVVKAQGFYGEHNQNNAILNDVLNGNITFSALGGSIYLGYQNTLKVLMRTDIYDTTGTKVILSKDGIFKGTIQSPTNLFATDGGGIDLNNSDIIGANSIFFSDTATGSAEALQFPKTTTPTGSFSSADYDSFRVFDGMGYLNDVPIFTSNSRTLWVGGFYMAEGQSISPSKPLSQCPNGWILCWSEYNNATTTAGDYDFVYTFIPKTHIEFGSLGVHNIVSSNTATNYTYLASKYLYISDTTITGHTANNEGTLQNIVLRRVYMI